MPIDPTNPKERIEFVIEDASLKYLIAQEKIRNNLSYNNCLFIDEDFSFLERLSKE